MHFIDIISDVSCPWCIIGYRSLKIAIDEMGLNDEVTISWRPFELNPTMPAEGQDRSEHIKQKYGLSPEQAQTNRQNLIDRGLAVGYEFNFPEKGRVYNTFNAHRLIHSAKAQGLQTQLKLALFDLYFKQGGNPSDETQLLNCVKEVGLDLAKAKAALESETLEKEIRSDQELTHQQGISAVPAFIFDNKYLVSGGQPPEAFENMFIELKKESN